LKWRLLVDLNKWEGLEVVRPEGLELSTFWFVAVAARRINNLRQARRISMKRDKCRCLRRLH
jgi:hypothetical protein